MNHKFSLGLIIFIIILVNAFGYFLRYFGFSTYFIFLGFRFHITLFLPLIFIVRKEIRPIIKKVFSDPEYRGKFLPLFWVLLPVLLIAASPFLTKVITEGDPDYFYEFGLSSLFDYPVYLLWNFPQLVFFYLFLLTASSGRKNKFVLTLTVSFFLFIFEFLPLIFNSQAKLNYPGLGALFLMTIICSILICFFENIYWFSVSVFTLLWSYFLAFGSKAAGIVNILFASRYGSWEGFLTYDKTVDSFLMLIYLFLPALILFIALPFRRRSSSIPNFSETESISQIPGMS